MASSKTVRVRVQVEAGSSEERAVADWLRAWRRRGVQRIGKTTYPWQGALIAQDLRGPAEAFAELRARLGAETSASIEPLVASTVPDADEP
ncbi:hypothetical protein [Nannocystis punicea]|uniref:Uncharacterized protein n=1 Tax=Nannocystis punicea TaxID=2995304 RepID=A0ABY7H929_9BACT|nr:hypothetical protein [Nannocystis poenicansa]WAS95781.1 hypothetical protein O0S08_06425 [Nannocystis poenicansa]